MPLHIHVDLPFMACSGCAPSSRYGAQARSYPKSADSTRTGTDHRNPRCCNQDFFTAGTGTPAILTLNMPRLVRVQKYTVFQSSPPKATLAVLLKPCTTRPSLLPLASMM